MKIMTTESLISQVKGSESIISAIVENAKERPNDKWSVIDIADNVKDSLGYDLDTDDTELFGKLLSVYDGIRAQSLLQGKDHVVTENEEKLPTPDQLTIFMRSMMNGYHRTLEGLCADCVNIYLLHTNENYDSNELSIALMNTTAEVFENVLGYSIEKTELFDWCQRSTYEHISKMNIEHLYTAASKEPLYFVIKSPVFNATIEELMNADYRGDIFAEDSYQNMCVMTQEQLLEHKDEVAGLEVYGYIGDPDSDFIFRLC